MGQAQGAATCCQKKDMPDGTDLTGSNSHANMGTLARADLTCCTRRIHKQTRGHPRRMAHLLSSAASSMSSRKAAVISTSLSVNQSSPGASASRPPRPALRNADTYRCYSQAVHDARLSCAIGLTPVRQGTLTLTWRHCSSAAQQRTVVKVRRCSVRCGRVAGREVAKARRSAPSDRGDGVAVACAC
jgi:hypothetical protein